MENTHAPPLIACHGCDLLLSIPELRPGQKLLCPRCHTILERYQHNSVDPLIAYAIATGIALLVGHLYPLLAFSVKDMHSSATLLHAIQVMYQQNMGLISLMVLVAVTIAPVALLSAILYLFVPMRFGFIMPGFTAIYNLLNRTSPWVMVEVLILGILVAYIKMSGLAQAAISPGTWAFFISMFLFALISGQLNEHRLWRLHDNIQRYGRA